MIESSGVDPLVRLTELLAAHGVYALTAIAVFYLEWRARRNLSDAATKDHGFFKKVYASVLALSIALMGVSTAVWIYATFSAPHGYIRGSVMELTEQPVRPATVQDPPKIVQQIVPQSFDVDLYQSKKIKAQDSTDGKYDLGWVLLPREDVRTLGFRFQHHYEIMDERGRHEPARDPIHISSGPALEKKTISKKFTIDLGRINHVPGAPIDLVYEPDPEDAMRKVGRILMRRDGSAPVPIPWEEAQSATRPAPTIPADHTGARAWLFPVAFAQGQTPAQKPPFSGSGEYDAQFGRVLKARLASPDLATQLQARRVLVESGNRAFPFVRDTLGTPLPVDHDTSFLYQNVAEALTEIAAGGVAVPPDIYLKLANVFYDERDYASAAKFFDRVGNGPFESPEIDFRRGFVYSQTEQYPKAIAAYHTYLNQVQNPRSRAVALTNLGIVAEDLRRSDEAIAYYQKAINADPDYASALNNLAYLYAERGEKLDEALRLANSALQRDPRSPLIKDTKGWVLYKLRRYGEAVPVLTEAAAEAPDETVIREHLQIATKAAQTASSKSLRR